MELAGSAKQRGDLVIIAKIVQQATRRKAFATNLRAFGHRSRAMQMGYAPEEWKGRPVIAILNTWSDAQPCHMHFKSRVDDVKRGVLMAGWLSDGNCRRCRCQNCS